MLFDYRQIQGKLEWQWIGGIAPEDRESAEWTVEDYHLFA